MEDDLLSFLRWWAEHHKRKLFPPTLDPDRFVAALKEMHEAGELVELEPEEESNETLVKTAMTLVQGMLFLKQMKPENDWHYAGEGVALGEANTAIAWSKPLGADAYRVIYGDLTVLDAPVDRLPAAPTDE